MPLLWSLAVRRHFAAINTVAPGGAFRLPAAVPVPLANECTIKSPSIAFSVAQYALKSPPAISTDLPAGIGEPRFPGMFDMITAELTTAADKLTHLRRFL